MHSLETTQDEQGKATNDCKDNRSRSPHTKQHFFSSQIEWITGVPQNRDDLIAASLKFGTLSSQRSSFLCSLERFMVRDTEAIKPTSFVQSDSEAGARTRARLSPSWNLSE
jgi:hypothetical protein